jgi:dipeptidyl aminopeptidase/acylaminoacyl peptidase
MVREIYRGLFGGPPWDPRFIEHYRAISPSARAEHFEGSLLQMHTDMVAPYGVELDQMLKEASVPTEMIAYPDETHILHRPRTRVSAMRTSFDWFEFWLNGREVPDPAKADQYARWRELRQKGCESPRLRSRIFCRSD